MDVNLGVNRSPYDTTGVALQIDPLGFLGNTIPGIGCMTSLSVWDDLLTEVTPQGLHKTRDSKCVRLGWGWGLNPQNWQEGRSCDVMFPWDIAFYPDAGRACCSFCHAVSFSKCSQTVENIPSLSWWVGHLVFHCRACSVLECLGNRRTHRRRKLAPAKKWKGLINPGVLSEPIFESVHQNVLASTLVSLEDLL